MMILRSGGSVRSKDCEGEHVAVIRTKPFTPAWCQWISNAPEAAERRMDIEVGRRSQEGEREAEKGRSAQ